MLQLLKSINTLSYVILNISLLKFLKKIKQNNLEIKPKKNQILCTERKVLV